MGGDSTSVEDPWSTSTGLSLLLTAVCRKSFRSVPHPHEKKIPNISISAIIPWYGFFLQSSQPSCYPGRAWSSVQRWANSGQVNCQGEQQHNIIIIYSSFTRYNGIILANDFCYDLPIQAISHPYYNAQNFNNDITLLKLSSPVQMTSRVSPVCLASSSTSIPSGTKCVTTGWGRTGQTCEQLIAF